MSNSLEKPQLTEWQFKVLRHFVRAESMPFSDFDRVWHVLFNAGMSGDTIDSLHKRMLMEATTNKGKPTAKLYCFPTDLAKRLVAEYEAYKEALKDAGDE